ncbi:MAG: hypothetical protein HY842_00980 [Bacteroidetes bacterium]|nr:hypothetical protein [Bacteroidota bacterium]
MKSNIISICCFFLALAQISAQSSQSTRLVFQPITLTGDSWKILPDVFQPRWQVAVTGSYFLNNPVEAQTFDGGGLGNIQQVVYSNPALFGQLFEALGGEFFIGNPSGHTGQGGFSQEQSPSLGLAIALRLAPRLQVEGGAALSRSEVGADFPVAVFSQQHGQPQTLQGSLNTELEHLRAQLGGTWFFGKSTFQPFLGAGFQFSKTAASTTQASMADVRFPVGEQRSVSALGAYGTAGVEVHPAFPLFFKAAFQVGTEKTHSPGGAETALHSSVLAGIGWRF